MISEIHSFFLGGSIRILKLEELIRTKFLDENGQADIVNRFGLETEDSGSVKVNLNICWQSAVHKKNERKQFNIRKQIEQLETKKRIMDFKVQYMKKVNEQAAETEEHVYDDDMRLNPALGDNFHQDYQFDERNNVPIIHTNQGNIARFVQN